MRITPKDCQLAALRLVAAVGGRMEHEPGGFSLSHDAHNGGYVISLITEGYGEARPFGDQRMPAREFYHAAHMAAKAVEHARKA